MNLTCPGFYYIKSSNFRREPLKSDWINANFSINAEINRYILEIKHIGEEDDIYDEDDDDKVSKMIKYIRLQDFKCCEPRGFQRHKDISIHVLVLIPKMFSSAKRIFLAFLNEEAQLSWYKCLELILTHKFQNQQSTLITPDLISTSSAEQFMIDNEVYEGSYPNEDIIATVIENETSKQIGIKGNYTLVVTETGLELREISVYQIVKFWEMKNIRKFGEKDNIFFMELGKHCEEGSGFLSFKVTQMKLFWSQLLKCKDNCLKKKQNKITDFKTNDNIHNRTERTRNNASNSMYDDSLTLVGNLTYNSVQRFSSIKEDRLKNFQPPLIEPPSIPQTVIERISKTKL